MNIVEVADLLPGACYVTGRNDGPFIDTGFDVDDRPNVGRVYIASSFISDCSAMLGGLGPEPAQILRDAVAARDTRIFELELAVTGLTVANEALVKAGYSPTAFAPVEGSDVEGEPDGGPDGGATDVAGGSAELEDLTASQDDLHGYRGFEAIQ